MLKEVKSKDGGEIAYCLEGKPLIIKPIEERYKTLRGVISGVFSATRWSNFIKQNGQAGMISGIFVSSGGVLAYCAELGDRDNAQYKF